MKYNVAIAGAMSPKRDYFRERTPRESQHGMATLTSLLQSMYLQELLHLVSQGLLYPTIVILLILIVYAIWCIGSLLVEVVVERRHYRVVAPRLIAEVDAAPFSQLPQVIEESGLLRDQKTMLKTLVAYSYLPEEARVALAKRLLADMEYQYDKVTSRTDLVAKVSPMFGLMGTLIPLGPGIVSLGQGQTEELASSIEIAFDTTVAGLIVAAVALFVSRFRKRWYDDYLTTLESLLETILDKARHCIENGESLGDEHTAAAYMDELAAKKGKAARASRQAAEQALGKAGA